MIELKDVWKKVRLTLFFPEEKRIIPWLITGPLFLLFSSLSILAFVAPLQALLLFIGAIFMITSYLAPARISRLALGLTLFFALYCFHEQAEKAFSLTPFWIVQFLLSLFIARQTIFFAKEYLSQMLTIQEELEADNRLWRNRFDTLRDKMESDRGVWETEIEAAKQEAEEKIASVTALRRLVETAHSQIRLLEERAQEEEFATPVNQLDEERAAFVSTLDTIGILRAKEEEIAQLKRQIEEKEYDSTKVDALVDQLIEAREQNTQLEILLSEAKERLEEQRIAHESRRVRNQELLTTSSEKPITLQSLSKKAKTRT